MTGYVFEREDHEWSQDQWRALDRAVHRWVRVHGGSGLLAATAAWCSLADGSGYAALNVGSENRLGMPPLSAEDLARLRAEALVAADDATAPRAFVLDAANRFYLWRNLVRERDAAERIRTRRGARPVVTAQDESAIESDLDALFQGVRNAAIEPQRQAARSVVGRRLFVLTGGPGTGKTTTVLRMLLMLQRRAQRPLSIRIAAPTGKAAQRLIQALRQGKLDLRGHASAPMPQEWQSLFDAIPDADALTVHRLLGFEPWRNAFRRSRRDPIAADVVVVDEASMIDLGMLHALLDAVPPDTALILVGDGDQLTSVATGTVLMDLVTALEADASGDLVRLHHSFRAEQQLVALNEAVRAGDITGVNAAIAGADEVRLRVVENPRQLGERLAQWAKQLAQVPDLRPVLPAVTATDEARDGDVQIDTDLVAARTQQVRGALTALAGRQLLCALREDDFGAVAVNAVIERLLRRAWSVAESSEWYPGRAVIITRNDYAAGLFNGDVGLCLGDSAGNLKVWFEAARKSDASAPAGSGVRSFSPNTLPVHESAFAITIHKSQGSEYRHVAVLLPPETDNRILSRHLLYTAVSRARESVELWTSAAALRAALDRPIERQGGLRDRLAKS